MGCRLCIERVVNDQAALDDAYQRYTTKSVKRVAPYPSLDAIQNALDDFAQDDPKFRNFKPEQVVDLHLMKALDDGGFIRQVFGSR